MHPDFSGFVRSARIQQRHHLHDCDERSQCVDLPHHDTIRRTSSAPSRGRAELDILCNGERCDGAYNFLMFLYSVM